ncbi:MAG: HAMP domain-containing protein, partial [Actinomycetota bacterium]
MRVQMATQYALVTIVAGTAFVAVNFGVIERDTSGLTDALVGLGVITVAAAAAGWGIARYTLRPLRAVTATAQRISANTLDERIGLEGPDDELQQLATTIDALLARLEAGFERERRFVANASHEIRTPLAVTRTA